MLERRALGRTGLTVTSLGLGTAAIGVPYGAPGAEREPPDPVAGVETIASAVEAGVRLIDTAPAYGDAEALVGRALRGGPTDVVVATKLAIPPGGWGSLDASATRDWVRVSSEDSLRALGRDHLDVLQIHNATVDLLAEDVLIAALDDLRADGTVRSLGATVYGQEHALAAVACPVLDVVQVAHSVLDRRPEQEIVPSAAARGVAIVTRSVLLRGVLSSRGAALRGDPVFGPLGAAADAFRIAAGVSWDELPGAAVAFAAARPGITSVLLGPRDATELGELLAGAQVARTGAHVDASVVPELPGNLLDPSRWP